MFNGSVVRPNPVLAAIFAIVLGHCSLMMAATAEPDFLPILGCVRLAEIPDKQAKNLSGAAATSNGKFLVVAPDEGSAMYALGKSGESVLIPLRRADDKNDVEIDFEGVTRHGDGDVFFAVGSHSWRRKSIEGEHAKESYRSLKKRFETDSPDREKSRERLVRFEINPETGTLVGSPQDFSLRALLDTDQVLSPFREIPSKENGIDVEGIASDGEKLYLGFRGPVFRFGLAPILMVSPDHLDQAELRYVALEGRGVRDIARVSTGFLLIAGPVNDSALSFQLYFWDGEDVFPGERKDDPPLGTSRLLGTIATPLGGKAEALVVLEERDRFWDLLVLYDGPAGGSPACFRVPKP